MLGIIGMFITSIVNNSILQFGSDITGELGMDYFGYSVSMNASGDRIVVGAPLNDGTVAASDRGSVRVYSWNGTAWSQLGADIDGEASGDQFGYSVSINDAGDRIAVGGPFNDGTGSDGGHARVYSWNGTAWSQLGADIDGEATGDQSGYSVSLNSAGDRLIIGAPYNDAGSLNSNRGSVRVYSWNGTSWVKLGADIDGTGSQHRLGISVSINSVGDRIAVGLPYAGFGITRIFSWNGTAWSQLGSDIAGEASSNQSGYSISLNNAGDRIAIGAPLNGDTINNPPGSGHVRVYSWNGTAWVKLGADIDGTIESEYSGWSVCMNASGDRVVIGSPLNDGPVTNSDRGCVRVYSWNGTAWNKIGDVTGTGSTGNFGHSVSMNAAGNRIIVGAPYNDTGGTNRGLVSIYSV
jgi:hypothetical protein